MWKYILVLVMSVGFISPAFAGTPTMPTGPVVQGDGCEENRDCRDRGEVRCLRCEIDDYTCDYGDYGTCECRPGLVFDNRGQCISSRIDSQCGELKGKDRADCNHLQQDLCDCAVDKGCIGEDEEPPAPE